MTWSRRLDDTRALAALLCLIWGLMFVVQRVALEVAPPLWVGALRVGIAALALLPLSGRLRDAGRRTIRLCVILGFTNQVGFIGLQVAGLRTVAAGPAAAIVYLQPVLVVLASGPFLGERLTTRRLAGALLGFLGVAVVGLEETAAASAAGVLLLFGAALSWTVGAIVTSGTDEPVLPLIVGQHLVGAPVLLVAAALVEPAPAFPPKLVVCVAFAGLCGSALGWMLWSTLLRRGEAGVVSTWLFAVPVLAAVLGVVFLDEPVSVELVVGIALVACAVRLAAGPGARRRR